jgi:phosphoserine aminotransferase
MEYDKISEETKTLTETGYIKLYKNETTKGVKYNWEIKTYTQDPEELVKLNAEMEEKFPSYCDVI